MGILEPSETGNVYTQSGAMADEKLATARVAKLQSSSNKQTDNY